MTKKYFFIFSLLFFFAFSFITPVSAQENEIKGPLSKITFIHYKKENGNTKLINSAKVGNSVCYGFLAKGAKWKTTEDYFINPTNSALDPNLIQLSFGNAVTEWESHSSPAIFGKGILNANAAYQANQTDNLNTVTFGLYPDVNVIAVTNVWGYFGGALSSRAIVEWDMLFNTNYNWGDASTNPNLMDLQNIATHELGHSAGLADLYSTACNNETMFGYSTTGEITKRDLNTGDIKGIQSLY